MPRDYNGFVAGIASGFCLFLWFSLFRVGELKLCKGRLHSVS